MLNLTKGGQAVKISERRNWLDNIYCLADAIESQLGSAAIVKSVYERHGVNDPCELCTNELSDVFNELHDINAGLK